MRNIRTRGDTLDTEPLIGSTIPTAAADLARIRADALSNRVFVGNVVASDGRATAITVYANPPAGDVGFNRRFADRAHGPAPRPGRTAPRPLPRLPDAAGRGHSAPHRGHQHRLGGRTHGAPRSAADGSDRHRPLAAPRDRLHRRRSHDLRVSRAAPAGRREGGRDPGDARGDRPRHPGDQRDHRPRLRQPGPHRHHDARPVRLCSGPGPHRQSRRDGHRRSGSAPVVARAAAPPGRGPRRRGRVRRSRSSAGPTSVSTRI